MANELILIVENNPKNLKLVRARAEQRHDKQGRPDPADQKESLR
jgi:hypothetical protein